VDTTPEVKRATALAAWPGTWLRDEEATCSTRVQQPQRRRAVPTPPVWLAYLPKRPSSTMSLVVCNRVIIPRFAA